MQARIVQLEHQLAWFKRQVFGEKSERRHLDPPPEQMSLGEGLAGPTPDPAAPQPVAAHTRRRVTTGANGDEAPLFFDPARVPVEVIELPNPEVAGLPADADEVIGEKITHRLAQRPGSYVILNLIGSIDSMAEAPSSPKVSMPGRGRSDELPAHPELRLPAAVRRACARGMGGGLARA